MQISNEQFEDLKKTYEAAIKNCESDLETVQWAMNGYMEKYLHLGKLLERYKRCLQELIDNTEDEEEREDD